jgi:hypothetical protein
MPFLRSRVAALVVGWAVVLGAVGAPDATAATKYSACGLLVAAEMQAVLRNAVSQTEEDDLDGPFRGEVLSECSWSTGNESATVTVNVTRGPRTAQERADYLKWMRSGVEKMARDGWSLQERVIGGVACLTLRAPAGRADAPNFSACHGEKGGLVYSISIRGVGLQITMEQVKSLADKVAARIRA